MADVKLNKVVKRYGKTEVVHGVDLDIKHNEFVVLVGPSGCGKSTTLRIIAGLEGITSGDVVIGDRVVNDLQPRDRNISMVFQSYALYPHMSVEDNLGFGLKISGIEESEIEKRVQNAAEILGLDSLMDRMPAELSGGQRQRVAMGRAIVRTPDVFLFDEPLSNLDAKLRVQMRTEIKKLHQTVKTTVVYVTHDQVEAMTLADRVVVMRDGHIEQIGSPMEIFHTPVNMFVASFIGSPPMNMIDAIAYEQSGKWLLHLEGAHEIELPERFLGKVTNEQKIVVGIRPDDLYPVGHGMESGVQSSSFHESVIISEPQGTETILFIQIGQKEVQSKMLSPRDVRNGERLEFAIGLDRIHLFDKGTEQSLLAESSHGE
ncbi:sn-glycerol-3-phosphate ABC transporter ATP-binding protein UgpC [Vibrio sp. S9_S30]|uniref:ABC transporter ATP-binding protein n=1 Tax=Vibrio sp. S9_S30 TaxID=2720226 RepID=UPI00168111CD|nr:sn-glycerol-3-phosphate ABC transporter ATP-binding protein UgpC [Vibrio sp. S9_S30]MBD1556653.1 sn-glycerol-3-phosphate ABC transporter ATP-binding protein UgpC [Vibrio sp. S9_S30]